MDSRAEAPALSPYGHRVYWLDAARALAVVTVTINHAETRSILPDEELVSGSLLYTFPSVVLYVLSRLGVPLFLMITGALLLGRDYTKPETLSRFYRHNWLRLFLCTMLWLCIRFWFMEAIDGGLASRSFSGTLALFVNNLLLLTGTHMGFMWYMVMILSIYLLIPILAVAVDRLPARVFLFPALLIVLVSILIPNLNAFLSAAAAGRRLSTDILGEYIAPYYLLYLMAGWYLKKGALSRFPTGWLIAAFVLSLLGTAAFQHWIFLSPAHYSVRYADLGTLASSVFLFELIRRGCEKPPSARLAGLVRSLAVHGLGVYFVHHLIMSGLFELARGQGRDLQSYGFFLVLELAGLVGGYLLVLLTARIPPVARWLYLIQRPPRTEN